MFEVCEQLLVQEVGLLPAIFGLWLIFSFTGNLLFKD